MNSPTLIAAVLFLAASPLLQDGDEGFANPELLVTTEWLYDHLEDDDLRVVDVREAQAYLTGHILGAVHVSRSATFDPKSRGNIAPAEHIAALFGKVGIDEETHVVLYDEGRSTAAARVFWTLEVYGHAHVSVLDGGFAKWKDEDLDEAQDAPEIEPAVLAVKAASARLSTKDMVLDDVDMEDAAMIDSRSDREVAAGRIPGSIHIEWTHNYTDDDLPVFKSPTELRALYADEGVTSDIRVHAY